METNVKKSSLLENLLLSGICKIIFTLFSVAAITVLFLWQFERDVQTEPLPIIKTFHGKVHGKAIKEITKNSLPIKVGLYVEDFPKFSVFKEIFISDCIVWFSFRRGKVPLEIIDNFAIEDGVIKEKSAPIITHDGNKTTVKYHVRIDFKIPINYHQFPFNDHRIVIQIVNRTMNPEKMHFVTSADFFKFSDDFFLPDWKIAEKDDKPIREPETGFIHAELETTKGQTELFFPTVVFSFLVRNAGWFAIMMVFIPLILLLFLLFATLLLNIENTFRLSGSGGLLTTIILSYRFNVSGIAPKVGYATLADKAYIAIALIAVFVLVYQIIMNRMFAVKVKKLDTKRLQKLRTRILHYDSYMYFGMQVVLFCTLYFLFDL